MKLLYQAVGGVVLYVTRLVLGVLLGGWVLTVLWGWFIVPTFHLPWLGIVSAIGINLVVRFLTFQVIDIKPPERTTGERWAYSIAVGLSPLVSLGAGWVVHLFMGAS